MPSISLLLCILLFLCAKETRTDDSKKDGGRKIGDHCTEQLKCLGMNMMCKNVTRTSGTCQCRPGFDIEVTTNMFPPVTLCLAPARLHEVCYHDESCLRMDENAKCLQVNQQALCGCKAEHHAILDKSAGVQKCVPETQLMSSDLATFVGVGVGMTLFCGLTCLVLRIFARARFGPRRHHYANAHLAPPIMLSTEHAGDGAQNNSRHSSQRSSIGGSRRQSMLAPPARPGDSRRASNSSIRSTSSARSYSLKNHHQHRPSDPETHLSPYKLPDQTSSANVSPSSRSHQSHSPHKGGRSSSTGAIGT